MALNTGDNVAWRSLSKDVNLYVNELRARLARNGPTRIA